MAVISAFTDTGASTTVREPGNTLTAVRVPRLPLSSEGNMTVAEPGNTLTPLEIEELAQRLFTRLESIEGLLREIAGSRQRTESQPIPVIDTDRYRHPSRIMGKPYPGYCQHWHREGWHCRFKAKEDGYCLTHHPDRAATRHNDRQPWLCKALRTNGTPCQELRYPNGFCRHHQPDNLEDSE